MRKTLTAKRTVFKPIVTMQHTAVSPFAHHQYSHALLQAERMFTFADHVGTVAVNGCGPETQFLDASNWGSRTIYR